MTPSGYPGCRASRGVQSEAGSTTERVTIMSLYDLPVTGEIITFCGGNNGDDVEACLAAAEFPGGVEITDTKPDGRGRALRATTAEADAFALGWCRQRGLI